MQACHHHPGTGTAGLLRSDAEFVEPLTKPVRAGWGLWFTTLPSISLYTFPLATAMALTLLAADPSLAARHAEAPHASFALVGLLAFWGCFAFGIALVGVLLSRGYLHRNILNPYIWTIGRLASWLTVWLVIFLGCIVATSFFMSLGLSLGLAVGIEFCWVPGLVVMLKLFWADELALMHRRNPFDAIRESWILSGKNHAGFFRVQLLAGLTQYAVLIPAIIIVLRISSSLDELGMTRSAGRSMIQFTVIFWLVFIVYGLFHATETVFFYGIRARAGSATPSAKAGHEPVD